MKLISKGESLTNEHIRQKVGLIQLFVMNFEPIRTQNF